MAKVRRLFSALLRHWKITAPATVVVIGAAVAVIVATTDPEPAAVAYANVSRNFRVCMLATTNDTPEANRVWPASQTAAARAPINAERVTAPVGTSDQLVPYVNGLVALHCGVIITAGPELAAPVAAVAKTHPGQRFLAAGQPPAAANVETLPGRPEDLTAALLTAAQHGNPAH
jgi:hypothetical protein